MPTIDLQITPIETGRLVLSMPEPNAAERVFEYLERNWLRFGIQPSAREPGQALASLKVELADARISFRAGRSMRLYAFDKSNADGSPIGDVALSEIIRGPFQACFLGYRIDGSREGLGLASEAVMAIVEYAFSVLNIHRIMANYIPTNERSGRLLKRNGFVVEGYARDYLFLEGEWRDHILTSLNNPNWQRVKLK